MENPTLPPNPDPLVLHRLYQLWNAIRPWCNQEITATWCARTLVRFDGGPLLDPGQLGPVDGLLGYRPVRGRYARRRVNAWLVPGPPPARVGRPLALHPHRL